MLLSNDNGMIRVLQTQGDRSLIIDCMKRTMPKWVNATFLSDFVECSETNLYDRTGMIQNRELTQEEQRIAQEHFTMIAAVLPFIGNEPKRNEMIDLLSEHQSKQTIRKYLCLYLVYQNLAALAPGKKVERKELSQDEKNMRWALNKFFYTQHKNSLNTAYTMLLQAKYCDTQGQLMAEYPSFNQFRYFYRKTKKMQQFYISRDGLKHYQRNNRPLLGDGVQQFAPAVGVGMLDSTICDIYLVDDGGKLVGRPVMTACVDAFSGLCCGYSLGWEGGTYSLRSLMLNVIADKQEWCRSHGVFIEDGEWDAQQMPGVLVTDMGSEYKGDTFSQVAELGVKVVNLPPYRPELKGMVEKFFDVIQTTYKKHLKGKGVIEPDYQERGAHDYRKDACLTIREFEQIILHCIVYYNNRRVIDYPFTEEMLADGIKPYANEIYAWGRKQMGANLIEIEQRRLILTLLPRESGRFTRKGLQVNGLRYRHDDYTEAFLSGGEVTVAYNPEDVTEVWIMDSNENRYYNLDLASNPIAALKLDDMSEHYVGIPFAKYATTTWEVPNDMFPPSGTEYEWIDWAQLGNATFDHAAIITKINGCQEFVIGISGYSHFLYYTHISWLDYRHTFVIQNWLESQSIQEIIEKVREDFAVQRKTPDAKKIEGILRGVVSND